MNQRKKIKIASFIASTLAVTWEIWAHGAGFALTTASAAAGVLFFPVIIRGEELGEAVAVERPRSAHRRRGRRRHHAPRRRRALILGAGDVGRALGKRLEEDGRFVVVGFIDDDHADHSELNWPVLGNRESTSQVVNEYSIDQVFLAFKPTWQHELAEELTAGHPHLSVQVVPSFYEAMMRSDHVDTIGDMALVPLRMGMNRARRIVKRTFDTFAAMLILAIFAPVMAAVALLIELTSPGPVIFSQERVGQYGDLFTLYKFRTMYTDAEAESGPVLSPGSHDPRITPVGKWLRILRIDELPQLWNVFKGEMSLVGPRPERAVFVAKYAERDPIYVKRHLVRPGITGLAQVFAGYHSDGRDKLRFDLIYISHQSIKLDVKILFQTLVLICRSRSY